MAPGRFLWSSAALSDVGLVRRVNEDACLDACERGTWAVADGMGGHDFGDVASGMLVQALACQPSRRPLTPYTEAIRIRLQKLNDDLRTVAAMRGVPMIGTTVVALLAVGQECAVLWAGDSRAYLLRRGLLRQLTQDHRQADCPAPASADGVTGPARAADTTGLAGGHADGVSTATGERSPTASASNVITRAVGASATLLLDETRVSVEDGDIFLLCSDGLSNMVMDIEIAHALMHGSCRQAAQALVSLALQRGGGDNVTVVVASATDLDSNERTVFNPAV